MLAAEGQGLLSLIEGSCPISVFSPIFSVFLFHPVWLNSLIQCAWFSSTASPIKHTHSKGCQRLMLTLH